MLTGSPRKATLSERRLSGILSEAAILREAHASTDSYPAEIRGLLDALTKSIENQKTEELGSEYEHDLEDSGLNELQMMDDEVADACAVIEHLDLDADPDDFDSMQVEPEGKFPACRFKHLRWLRAFSIPSTMLSSNVSIQMESLSWTIPTRCPWSVHTSSTERLPPATLIKSSLLKVKTPKVCKDFMRRDFPTLTLRYPAQEESKSAISMALAINVRGEGSSLRPRMR